MMTYKTRKEVAAELGVTGVTVWRWAKRLGIAGYADQYDQRTKLFSEPQVEELRKAIVRDKHYPKSE